MKSLWWVLLGLYVLLVVGLSLVWLIEDDLVGISAELLATVPSHLNVVRRPGYLVGMFTMH